MREMFNVILWFFRGLTVIFTLEDDPELWDNPRKKARIRRKMAKERRKHGKKADV